MSRKTRRGDRIQVRLMAANGLPAVNLMSATSDPYVTLEIASSSQRKESATCQNCLDPTWYEVFSFHGITSSDVLSLRVFDRNRRLQDVALGRADINLGEALNDFKFASQTFPSRLSAVQQKYLSRTYALTPSGSISVLIAPANGPSLDAAAPAKKFRQFQNQKMVEDVSNIGEQSLGVSPKLVVQNVAHVIPQPLRSVIQFVQPVHKVFQEHSTWKFEVLDVDRVFHGVRQHWNTSYDQARQIFEGPGSTIIQQTVKAQHAYLYGGCTLSVPVIRHLRQDLREVTGNLLDGRDLCKILANGFRRGKPRLFTYVLMERFMYVAETGANFFVDMSSKHAMHCSAAKEVVYAGELFFRQLPDRQNCLVVDNNSGTYAPNKDYLPHLVRLLGENFPGLAVEAYDFQDPRAKTFREELQNYGS